LTAPFRHSWTSGRAPQEKAGAAGIFAQARWPNSFWQGVDVNIQKAAIVRQSAFQISLSVFNYAFFPSGLAIP
jgi:hypothetical protein